LRFALRSLAVLLGAALLFGAAGLLVLRAYDLPGPLPENRAIVVPHGSIDAIAELMAKEGVVGNPTALRLAVLATRSQGPLRSAELAFPAHASLRVVLATLRAGKPVQHKLTIPEGLTALQVTTLLDRAPALDGDTAVPEEGSLLPETYSYELGTSRASLVERAQRAMERALEQAWANRKGNVAPLDTAQQVLVLASIVERETSRPEERSRVAAVFLNRLRRGMRLQSDPTVVYGASAGLGVLDHGLTRSELDRDDPYNTYRIPGLPPGPISMPGLASLRAVTQPWTGDELYFVADGQGGHVFARTDAEHQRNVARWRDYERQKAALQQKAPQN
jgi:UPF0755 protein